ITQKHEGKSRYQAPLVTSLLFLCIGGSLVFLISGRPEIIPDRSRFIAFPERIGPWQGRNYVLEPDIEQFLRPDYYILSDYKGTDGKAVNLYVAYYASQRKGIRPHSPSDCMPGAGWQITKFKRMDHFSDDVNWPLNRVLIEKSGIKQLVYYWFEERGR